MKRTVEFKAHKIIKKPTEIEFATTAGKNIDFIAKKKTRVPVRVKFEATVK